MKRNAHLFLEEEDWQIFISILANYQGAVYAYGSRVKGDHTKFSDIDIYIEGPVDLTNLREEFYSSNLPVKVDVKIRDDFSDSFFALIKEDFLQIKE